MLFTTITIDNVEDLSCGFWYIAPRNGHITIYTRKALEYILQKLNVYYYKFTISTGRQVHFAYNVDGIFA